MKRVLELFKDNHISYELFEHEPVYTSEQAARTRGVELKTGVKALVLKEDSHFLIADIAADRKLDFKKIENLLGRKNVVFAKREEVISVTGCEPGSVHPFGQLFGIDTYLDRTVLANDYVNFNIGVLTKSVRIKKDDLMKVIAPKAVGEFTKLHV